MVYINKLYNTLYFLKLSSNIIITIPSDSSSSCFCSEKKQALREEARSSSTFPQYKSLHPPGNGSFFLIGYFCFLFLYTVVVNIQLPSFYNALTLYLCIISILHFLSQTLHDPLTEWSGHTIDNPMSWAQFPPRIPYLVQVSGQLA
jgi:hypothetical protein